MHQRCSLDQAVEQVLQVIDGPIRLGLPLGLGKPVAFVNALYQRLKCEPQRQLVIYTALSLARPQLRSELERRFSEPFLQRLHGDAPELDYLLDLRRGRLPGNVRIEEFYLQPASQLDNPLAQQSYVSLNYSQVARDLQRKGINVIAQLVALDNAHPDQLSLSCNPDITLDLLPGLQARRAAGEVILCIAQAHRELPYMPGAAQIERACFDLLLDEEESRPLFSTPNMPVSLQDHAIGLQVSSLVRDGGTLQLGIGAMADAAVAALLARQTDNAEYQALLEVLGSAHWRPLIEREGGLQPFAEGLYGCSEMFQHGLLALLEAGVVRRPVYADPGVQALAARGALDERGCLTGQGLGMLNAARLVWLQQHGLLHAGLRLENGELVLPSGVRTGLNLADPDTWIAITPYLGAADDGVLIHGGFFLGPQAFYRRLRELSDEQRRRIGMTAISYINRLYGDEPLKRLQRRDARFINSCFLVTLLGASAADQLDDGRVLSGVGGQYDFVAQAHELEGARSILMLRSWREEGGKVTSNIRWDYAHCTIPRHLRDIVVTEYGIADLRGKADAEVIEALLQIADSRFQEVLAAAAIQAGKLPVDFRLEPAFRDNSPGRLLALQGRFPRLFAEYPLGCDFTPEEQDLLRALRWLQGKLQPSEMLDLGAAALFEQPDTHDYAVHLQRMGLESADGVREQLYRKLLLAALKATAA